jgi:hypothetical protein
LAVAYSQASGQNIVQQSLAAKVSHLAGGLFNPQSVAERIGWVFGLSDRSLVTPVQERFERLSKYVASTSPARQTDHKLRRAA